MSKQDQRELHLSMIEHLKTQYSALGLPCFALCISYRYRCLSRISILEKVEYVEKEKSWLMTYLNSRCLSKGMQSLLFDQVIDTHLFVE
jgi:hypothetical protein